MSADHLDVIIVGAGFGGMGAAIQLNRLGYNDIAILDREDDLGGTWKVNHYPGLAVDIPSTTYSYWFEPNPYWSRLHAPGTELKQYAEYVADKYDLRRYMRFNTTVEGARWDEDTQLWHVSLAGGESLSARILITATGYLSQPRLPDIPGVGSFGGSLMHTASWDPSTPVTDRRVGIIGTGVTAAQLIPELAAQAAQLTVFQRTPIWVIPKVDFPIPSTVQRMFARFPLTQRMLRLITDAFAELNVSTAVVHYRQTRILNVAAAALSKAHLFASVRDRSVRRKLTPAYEFGCKRTTFNNDYYRVFGRSNVDLETVGIDHIESDGIVTADGRKIPLDTLVLATGFDLWEANFPAIEVVGRDGRNLGKWWRENKFQTYEGISVPFFPNYFNLASPYAFTGASFFTMMECQMRHIDRLLSEVRRRGSTTFEVTDEANTRYFERMSKRLGDMVYFRGNCAGSRSYHFRGDATIVRPSSRGRALREASRFPISDYALG
ncbi:NAD(P)/FAD-dependent oxidoreductase [Mycobacterium sp. PS03-16]|uniref:flavin-containing monooxygenase n=1 Tax=Mycobacterium sp. PS03-16 TaxID=2559611 RepID=UPI001072FCAB|nr:NAD(P)/FAD-dependent oxidoreductase [Mycobacterium sp. PS03-16]TFV57985.1 NAD(P)/FAD-dependent oxidoreductase [Mycobacterium sp. PS03-16]